MWAGRSVSLVVTRSAPSELVVHDSAASVPAVSIRGIRKTFDDAGVAAIDQLDLSVPPGEFVSIVGLSGCGKSTLLRIVAGLIPATEGTVEVHGEPVTAPRDDVGLMFQRPALLAWRTALENVLVPVRLRRRLSGEDVGEAMRLLGLVRLDGFEHHFPQQLSGGMQQRVALARLLITGARVRLLDEPFGAVDELTRERLNLELLAIHERSASAALFVTHNIFEAVLLSDRVVVMTPRPGRIAAVVGVPLPRPRAAEMVYTPEFQEIAREVRGNLQLPSGSGEGDVAL
jgi:NitT/TauT family transport system ATP-binding protein